MTDAQQTFKLLGPDGSIIMQGALSTVMENLPDTHARNDALSTMLDTAVKQVEAEEQLEEARARAAQILADGITRLCARLDEFEKRRALSAKRAEAERQRVERRRVERYLDQLPDPDLPDDPKAFGIIPPAQDPTGAELESDGDDLTIKSAVDPERYGPVEEDAEAFDPNLFGERDVPTLGPEPGSRLYQGPPQIAPPTAISLNEET
jgi:hypothetical protein